jgi:hypothetical protein
VPERTRLRIPHTVDFTYSFRRFGTGSITLSVITATSSGSRAASTAYASPTAPISEGGMCFVLANRHIQERPQR